MAGSKRQARVVKVTFLTSTVTGSRTRWRTYSTGIVTMVHLVFTTPITHPLLSTWWVRKALIEPTWTVLILPPNCFSLSQTRLMVVATVMKSVRIITTTQILILSNNSLTLPPHFCQSSNNKAIPHSQTVPPSQVLRQLPLASTTCSWSNLNQQADNITTCVTSKIRASSDIRTYKTSNGPTSQVSPLVQVVRVRELVVVGRGLKRGILTIAPLQELALIMVKHQRLILTSSIRIRTTMQLQEVHDARRIAGSKPSLR